MSEIDQVTAALSKMRHQRDRLLMENIDLRECLKKAALSLDDMEAANAMLNRDMMAATCLVISNEIRNTLTKAAL
jgi:hypothetical protein